MAERPRSRASESHPAPVPKIHLARRSRNATEGVPYSAFPAIIRPMAPPVELLGTYLQLVRGAELRRQPLVRDRVLVLAAVLAVQMEGLTPIAECCRERVLAHNRGHMLSRWPTVAEARLHE